LKIGRGQRCENRLEEKDVIWQKTDYISLPLSKRTCDLIAPDFSVVVHDPEALLGFDSEPAFYCIREIWDKRID